ncbi:hypothetical protein H0H92_001892 [Tricholoma furcatifolium]|nr:hypothetical protein H0H92_001892 [Tricholoma furcatifolium]
MNSASGGDDRGVKELTRSPHPNLKVLAAQNICSFFSDFPDLEEEAINAVYDLCEDQTPSVRIEGYTAVTSLSKADIRLVRRNADVLLQLLQSGASYNLDSSFMPCLHRKRVDEPDEVEIVKNALREHLELDAKVTLGVLCDQITPLEDSMEDEEQEIRDRLRNVVLKFLTQDARKAVVEKYVLPGSGAEEVLVDSLLTVLPKLEYKDVEIIVEELLLKLKSFKTPQTSSRGPDLVKALVDKVIQLLSQAADSSRATLLQSAQPYLDLASFVVIEKRVAPATQLLREYLSTISTKLNLQKFRPSDRQTVVCRLAETFAAARDTASSSPSNDSPSLETLSRSIVDSCPFLLEALQLTPSSPLRQVKACTILLQVCVQRQQSSTWTPRPNLAAVLSVIQANIPVEQSQDIHNLIRSLVPPASTSGQAQSHDRTMSTPQSTTNGRGHASLPDRPLTTYPSRRMHIASASNSRPQVRNLASELPPSTSTKRPSELSIPPSAKRQRSSVDTGDDSDTSPSLLSRMGETIPSPRANLPPAPQPRNAADTADATDAQTPMLSIKGAAKSGGRNAGHLNPRSTPSFSLLERLEGSAGVESGRGGWPRRTGGR